MEKPFIIPILINGIHKDNVSRCSFNQGTLNGS